MADSLLFKHGNTLIQYAEQWPVTIDIPGDPDSYDAHCTPKGGDSSLKFVYEFSGTLVAQGFYRYYEGLDIRVKCIVDGTKLEEYPPPQNTGTYTSWMFCNMEHLPQQNHTVQITVAGDYNEDFCFYGISVKTTPQLSSALHNSTSMPQPPAPSMPQSHLGAIIGGTLGGVAFILLCGGLFFLWTRIRGQHKYSSMYDDEDAPTPRRTQPLRPFLSRIGVIRPLRRDTESESPGYGIAVEARPPTSPLTRPERKSTSLSEKSFKHGAGPARDPTARPEDLENADAAGRGNAPSHFVQSPPQSRDSSPPRASSYRRPSFPS